MEEARLLIVDNAADHRYLLTAALHECAERQEVIAVGTMAEALDALGSREFDAILCDHRLEGTTGLELLKEVRARGFDVPVLLVTNHGSEELARQAFVHGAADYLTKDAALRNPQDLLRKVRRAIERQRLKSEKQRAEAILTSFLENNPYGILIFTSEGRIVRWNRALALLEEASGDIARLGASYNPLTDPQLRSAGVTMLLEQALAGRCVDIPPFEWDPARSGLPGRARVFRGAAFPLDVAGEPKPHLCAMIQDVTEQQRARRERDEYAAILARLLDATHAAIFFVTPDLSIRFANRHVESLFGVSPGRLIGRDAPAVFEEIAAAAADPQGFAARLRYLCENPEEEGEEELDLLRPQIRHVRHHTGPVRDGEGRLLGRICVYTDETEAVEKRRMLEAQNRELDSFASRLAHDLKTPLVSLKGFVDLLHRQYASTLDERGALFLDKVRSSASILGEMVDGLRELAHAGDEVHCATPVEPLPILRLVADALGPEAVERGVEVSLPSDCSAVECDRARLFQIFQNLLSNAIRHCDPAKPQRWVRVEVEPLGSEVIIRVSDNGLGIEPDELPEIFRPFRRGRQATGKPGMGLGLAIVNRIAQVCGGRIETVSTAGQGSTFSVHLPKPR